MSTKNYPGYKKVFLDVETTGTDRQLHHIFQLAGAIVDIDGSTLEKFNFRFRPISCLNAEPGALEKTGVTLQDLQSFPLSAGEVYTKFTDLLGKHCNKFDKKDKYQFIAYNSRFDEEFLREFFMKHGDNYFGSWFFTPSICLMQGMAMFLLDHRGALPNFRLGTLCEAAGFPWDESRAHDAEYDIEQTMNLFNYLRENTRILGE